MTTRQTFLKAGAAVGAGSLIPKAFAHGVHTSMKEDRPNILFIFTDHGDGSASHRWAAKLTLYEEPGVFQIIIRSPVGDIPKEWDFRSTGCPVPDGFWADALETETGYAVQFFLPEKSISEIHGSIRDTFYMDVAVKDVSPDGSRKGHFWKSNGDNWRHPHNFAPLTPPKALAGYKVSP